MKKEDAPRPGEQGQGLSDVNEQDWQHFKARLRSAH